MNENFEENASRPSIEAMEAELARINYRKRYKKIIRSTIYTLITVAAVAVLVATLWLPVLQIQRSSMTPTMADGNIVVSVKGGEYKRGDIIAFYYNNKILVKRIVALPGDYINIDDKGTVFINGTEIDEPYITDKAYGDVNIELPYQVPAAKYFVMGDHRNISVDSRNTAVGCVGEEQIVGKILFRVWPLPDIGSVN